MENIKLDLSLSTQGSHIYVPHDPEDVRDHKEMTSGDGFVRELELPARHRRCKVIREV